MILLYDFLSLLVLTHLSFEKCIQLTNPEAQRYKQQYPLLQSLNIVDTKLPYAALRSADLTYPYELLRPEDNIAEAKLTRIIRNEDTAGDLSSLSFEDEDMPAVVAALERSIALQDLNLQNNKISSAGLKNLAKPLRRLKVLDISHNQIDGEGIQVFVDLYSTLKSLSISGNPIGTDGIVKLSEELALNCSLNYLALRECMIRPRAASALAHILDYSMALKSLDLGRNLIGDEGATALAVALKEHHVLTDLNLRNNMIGSIGGKALAEAIASNTRLLYIDFNSNNIDAADKQSIEESLKRNLMLKAMKEETSK